MKAYGRTPISRKALCLLPQVGCGAGLRPSMGQRRAPWSHWPNFRPRNTTLFMSEKRGAWVRIKACLWFFVLSQALKTWSGLCLAPCLVPRVCTTCSHMFYPLLFLNCPWYCGVSLYLADPAAHSLLSFFSAASFSHAFTVALVLWTCVTSNSLA